MTTRAEILSRYCADLGWYLVAIPAGSKAPRQGGWQLPERAITTPEAAHEYWTRNPDHNAGLLHHASGTVALDIDNVEWTRIAFDGIGLDYDDIMSKAPRIVGRPTRAKALFKAPTGIDLSRRSIAWPTPEPVCHSCGCIQKPASLKCADCGAKMSPTETVFEFRAGAVQDVLPPSIHPDTGNPYTWAGPSIWDGLPDLPAPILTIWREWDRFAPQFRSMCPWKPEEEFRPPSKTRPAGDRTSVIDSFNAANDIHELLARYGYKRCGRNRYLSPNSKTKLAGVVVFDDARAYSHHASDPFDSAHTFDAFDLFCQYEHGGDVSKSVKDAGAFLHIDSTVPEYDAEAIAHGKTVADAILPSRQKATKSAGEENPLHDIPEHLLSIPGRLQDMVNYYNTTAHKPQPQFAVQAALAFGSVVLGRRWVTDQNNYSALYFINVGKSASGKEHAKTVIEDTLDAAGLSHLIGPSGYTSASGVFSALLDHPSHITIIDELGRVLASAQAAGNHNKADVQTILLETFGRAHGTLRPQGYSKAGLNKQQAKELSRVVLRPSLSLLAMTTPSTLYESLTSRSVKDGFLGRFIIVESYIGRQLSRPIKIISPSEGLIDWAKDHATARGGDINADGDTPPPNIEVPFSQDCLRIIRECDSRANDMMNEYEKFGLEEMFGRDKEIAQRVALIVARSCGEDEVSAQSMQWAVDYVEFYSRRVANQLKKSLSDGPFDAACKAVSAAIEASGLRGMTEREISRYVRAFGGMEPRRRREVMDALSADKGIVIRKQQGSRGAPRMAWIYPPDAE